MQIYAIQEREIKSHLKGLEYFAESNSYDLQFIQFSLLRPIISSVWKKDSRLLLKELYSSILFLRLLPKLLFGSPSTIILGIAPYDYRLFFLFPFLFRHKVYLHTSWPNWGFYEKSPHLKLFGLTYTFWKLLGPVFFEGVFCVSSKTAQSIKKHFPLWPELKIVGHAIDECWFLPNPKNHLNKKKSNIQVAYVGRLVPEKGIDRIILLAKKFPKVDFNLYGNGPLMKTIDKMQLTNLYCHGYINNQNDLIKCLDNCDIIVQPSREGSKWTEAFGIGLLQGMARGLLPVTSNNTGSKEVLGAQLNHFCFNEEIFIQKFSEVLNDFDYLKTEYQYKCVLRSKEFSQENVSQKWKELIMK